MKRELLQICEVMNRKIDNSQQFTGRLREHAVSDQQNGDEIR